MRILVLGAGGTGGYFGGRLMQAGADVTFLVRPRRHAQLMEQGLIVASPLGDIRTPVQAATKPRGTFDAILFSAKAYDLEAAIAAVAPGMGPDSVLVPLLNGLAHLDVLDAAFGRARVLGGLCHIAATLEPDGTVRHLNRIHRIAFGPRDPAAAAAVERLAAAFRPDKPDIPAVTAVVSADPMQEMWEKFVFLCTLAAGTCLMRAPLGTITGQPGGADLMSRLHGECTAVATAAGHAPRDRAREEALRLLLEPGSPLAASMLRDIQRGGPTEGDHVVGDMCRRAEAAGISVPSLSLARLHLAAYEASRGGAG